MAAALDQARLGLAAGEVPIGAVLVIDDRIVARAFNQPISAVDPTAHAEILVLREAARIIGNYRLLDATVYVTLEPCVMCAGAIVHARVARVVFATDDPKTGAAGSVFDTLNSDRHNHRVEVVKGLCANESSNLLRAFFRQRRN